MNSTGTVNAEEQHSVVLKLKPDEEMLVRLQSVPTQSQSDGSLESKGHTKWKTICQSQTASNCTASVLYVSFYCKLIIHALRVRFVEIFNENF